MPTTARSLRDLSAAPDPVRGAVVGGLLFGLIGAVAGLVLGLHAYPPTAWAAVVEVGAPAGVLGVVGGGLVGLLRTRRYRS